MTFLEIEKESLNSKKETVLILLRNKKMLHHDIKYSKGVSCFW